MNAENRRRLQGAAASTAARKGWPENGARSSTGHVNRKKDSSGTALGWTQGWPGPTVHSGLTGLSPSGFSTYSRMLTAQRFQKDTGWSGLQTGLRLSLRKGQTSHDETRETGKDSEWLDGVGGLLWGEEKAGLTFRIAAKAGPKVALTSTRSRIQAGSFARIGGRAYRWSRSTMLAKSFWCLMALPGWGQRVGLWLNLPPRLYISFVCPPLPQPSDPRDGK